MIQLGDDHDHPRATRFAVSLFLFYPTMGRQSGRGLYHGASAPATSARPHRRQTKRRPAYSRPPRLLVITPVPALVIGHIRKWGWSAFSAAHRVAIFPYSRRKLRSFSSLRWCSKSKAGRSVMRPSWTAGSCSLVQTWC